MPLLFMELVILAVLTRLLCRPTDPVVYDFAR